MGAHAYQLTRYGEGFDERKRRTLAILLIRLNRHLRRIHGPYQINDQPAEYGRKGVVAEVRKRFNEHPNAEARYIIRGSRYDEAAWSVRSIEKVEQESQLVTWCQKFVGHSSYELGATGPPGLSDCSSTTQGAVKAVYGIDLVHSADAQSNDSRIEHFHDPGNLRSGDFVFLNYGRLNWPSADHVEFYVSPGKTIGSRPSTSGVNYYRFTSFDAARVITYGRLKAG
jgi:hypothetical protein